LVELARSNGASVLEGYSLDSIGPTGQWVEATANGVRFRARFVVAADGMWSPTRKLLGLSETGYRGEWHAFRQYFTGVTGPAATELLVWFEPDLLPGYAWSFPLAGGVANLGFGIQRASGIGVQDMGRLWPRLLARPHIAAALGPGAEAEAPHRAWPIPARLPTATLSRGRVLFVGDAASATDPMTGEGIGQALETARLAVAAILEGGTHRPEAVAARYRRELERGMMHDHRLAGRLSRVLEHPRAASAAVTLAGLNPWTRANFGRWLFEDYPRAVLLTPRRWHRRLLAAPGAFANEPSLTLR
jgi:flavin-dependent dehydrogenase